MSDDKFTEEMRAIENALRGIEDPKEFAAVLAKLNPNPKYLGSLEEICKELLTLSKKVPIGHRFEMKEVWIERVLSYCNVVLEQWNEQKDFDPKSSPSLRNVYPRPATLSKPASMTLQMSPCITYELTLGDFHIYARLPDGKRPTQFNLIPRDAVVSAQFWFDIPKDFWVRGAVQ